MSTGSRRTGILSVRSWSCAIVASAAIAGIASGGLSVPGKAAPAAASCPDLQRSRAALDRHVENGTAAVLADLEGEDARRWISLLNAHPPVTAYPGDGLLAVVSDDTDGEVMVALFLQGCEIGVGAVPAEIFVAIDTEIERGEPRA